MEALIWGEGQEEKQASGEGCTCTQDWPWQDNSLLTVMGWVKVGGVLLLVSPTCSADSPRACALLLSTKRSTEQLREGLPWQL